MIDKELLRRERQLSDADLQEVIARAARLQREAREQRHATVDVAEVAGELDIAPEYVDQALTAWQRDREQAARAEAERRARRARLSKGAMLAGAVLVVVAVGAAWSRGSDLRRSHASVTAAESRYMGSLARPAELLPQLVAISGGDAGALAAQARAVLEANTVDERVAATRAFDEHATRALAQLPPAQDASAEQRRLSLQHEITGARNRLSVERMRYEAARTNDLRVRSGLTAALARTLGFDR